MVKRLFLLVAIIIITSCKKYPEGPILTFGTVKYRIEHGLWYVDYFSVNGNDSSAYFKSPYHGEYRFNSPQGDNDPTYNFNYNPNRGNLETILDAHWEILNKKTYIETHGINNSIMPPNDSSSYAVKWEIQRLTLKDFWLQADYNGKKYYMKLKH